MKDLNMKISAELHQAIKIIAAEMNIKIVTMVVEGLKLYIAAHGTPEQKARIAGVSR